MTVERGVRLVAGVMVLLSLALAHYVSLYWLWLAVFVGLNLLQSAFTNWCPAMSILRVMGLKDAGYCSDNAAVVQPSEAGMNERRFNAAHAHRLDDPSRRAWLPPAEVLAAMALHSGETIADVGAGTGYFSLPLAQAVGPARQGLCGGCPEGDALASATEIG